MSHPDSHSGPPISSKNAVKGALNLRGEAIAFFIFPPNRCRRKKQNFLINHGKKFQQGKWEELWKQSISEFEVEKRHIKPQ